MAIACPAPEPDAPLVQSLLFTVDCNVQGLVRDGYATIFAPSSAFSSVLTALLTVYVALIGFQLLLGRSQLSISSVAMTVVKLGAVLALATQWGTYQSVVYNFLFDGPEQLARAVLRGFESGQDTGDLDVFQRLQLTFEALTRYADVYAKRAPATVSPFLGGAGFGALALNASSALLLFSSLGVLLAAKVVLGLLLAVGPVFIAMLLFDSTRGLFEGWLRASLAFAFAPLASTLLLGVSLTMLQPAIVQLGEVINETPPVMGPVYNVLTLVLVFVGVSAGALIAGAVIFGGFKLPKGRSADAATPAPAPAAAREAEAASQPRAVQIANAAAALDRREQRQALAGGGAVLAGGAGGGLSVVERRTTLGGGGGGERGAPASAAAVETRLGQTPRRTAAPRTARASRDV